MHQKTVSSNTGIWLQSQISKFQTHFKDTYLKYFLWNCNQVNATTSHRSLVSIGSGNGLVPSGNNHYLSQCWHRSMSPYGVTRPQWVKVLPQQRTGDNRTNSVLSNVRSFRISYSTENIFKPGCFCSRKCVQSYCLLRGLHDITLWKCFLHWWPYGKVIPQLVVVSPTKCR